MRRLLVPISISGAIACVGLVYVAYGRRGEAVRHDHSPITARPNSVASIAIPNLASLRADKKAPVAKPKELRPTFDIVDIGPSGEAVIAGRAAPGSTVELLGDGKVQGRSMAGRSGDFVMSPSRLSPGNYKLSLRSTDTDKKQAFSTQTVAVSLDHVSSPAPQPTSTLAAMATPQQSTTPRSTEAKVVPAPNSLDLATDKPRNLPPVAHATPRKAEVASGFAARTPITASVKRGDSLWRISRSTYGNGNRYHVIFDANRGHIRNPNLIYPGQIFVLPKH